MAKLKLGMLTLGIHWGSHDTSAALVENGHLLATIEQERFDHQKHTLAFPSKAIQYCLDFKKITISELDAIAYGSDPGFINQHKQDFIDQQHTDAYTPQFSNQEILKTSLYDQMEKVFPGANTVPLYLTDHHRAHAASTVFLSPFDQAAFLTIDGMGNWVTTTGGVFQNRTIDTQFTINHPHSLGLLYGAFTQYLGFRAACDECKVMGLASYGKPAFLADLRQLCRVDGLELTLDLNYFTFHQQSLMKSDGSFSNWYSNQLTNRFGPAREPESELNSFHHDMAHSVQALLEECAFELLRNFHSLVKTEDLCLGGGVALNSSMNGKITENTPFKNIFIVPAANDAGLSIGAALCHQADHAPIFQKETIQHGYFGSEHTMDEITQSLTNLPENIQVSKPTDLISETAKLLLDFKIVAWYQGRMEFGPRALGHRSILANPTKAETKDFVNQQVKFRENFRPFAPMIPLSEVGNYFTPAEEMPFMLKVVDVLEDKIQVIPAVTHVDGTARVQTVRPEQNPQIHDLLMTMKDRNGVPVLLNTSFNIRGDTIVRTPADAIDCFLKTGIQALVMGPFLLTKS